MSLQYLKNEVKVEVDFLDAEFPKSSFQHISVHFKVDIIIINGHDQVLHNVTSLQYLRSVSKRELEMEIIFGMQINVKVSTSWYYPF